MSGFVDSHDAFLLQNHGVVTLGRHLEDAFNKMEIVERYARILFLANHISKPQEIPEEMAKNLPGFEKIKLQLSGYNRQYKNSKEPTHEVD
jgi:L-fuculose-phosphate aldolase